MTYQPIHSLFAQAAPVLQRYLPAEEVEQMQSQLDRSAAQHRPVVMLYGLYNAGKSTLINALLGEEKAADGNVPTTSRVTAYDWRGYELFDTPGIDAPPEHERVTHEQLRKSDIVIMVLHSRGATQELESYRTILRLLEQGQQVLVVVNSVDGLTRTNSEAIAVIDDIRATLQRLAPEKAQLRVALDCLQVVWVSAKSGLKAKLEHKAGLLNSSGLPLLEGTLERMIANTGAYERRQRQVAQILPQLDAAARQLDECLQSSETGEAGRLALQLEDHRQHAEQHLLYLIERQRRTLKSRLGPLLKEPDTAARELDALNGQLASELEQALYGQLARLGVQFDELAATSPGPDMSGWVPETMSTPQSGNGDTIKMPDVAGLIQGMNKEQIQQAIELAQRLLPKLFGQFNRKATEKMADGVILFNPVLMVLKELVFNIWEFYWEKREAQDAAERQIRYHQQLRDVIEQAATEYARQAQETVRSCLDTLFARISEQLSRQRQSWQGQHRQWAQDLHQINTFRRQLIELRGIRTEENT